MKLLPILVFFLNIFLLKSKRILSSSEINKNYATLNGEFG